MRPDFINGRPAVKYPPADAMERGIGMNYVTITDHVSGDDDVIEEVLLLDDVSPSMDNDDWPPSRKHGVIEANKELCRIKRRSHPNDKVGIMAFGGEAEFLQKPLCLKSGIERLYTAIDRLPSINATNFNAPLQLTWQYFSGNCEIVAGLKNLSSSISKFLYGTETAPRTSEKESNHCLKRIIFLSDGEHLHGPSPLPIATALKNAGVIIDCIGIGGTAADVDEAMLKAIASRNRDGSIRYSFIGDKQQLIQKYQTLARHIRPV